MSLGEPGREITLKDKDHGVLISKIEDISK